MCKFLDIPYDVFSAILELTDAESLLAVSRCNRKCREWAGTPLLWKEIVRNIQGRGIQLPADGFSGVQSMSLEQLKRSALRACRIQRNWSSLEARPTRSCLIDCSPSRYQHGVFHTTQRLRWIIPITADFFAVKLGYHLSSGFLQIWRRDADAPRIVVNYQYDWVTWGHCTDLENMAWYFIFSERNPNQHGHTLHVMRFSGFDSNPRIKLGVAVVAKYPTYGSLINVFLLGVSRRTLCALYCDSPTGTITLFFVPDWLQKASVHIDTGIEDDYRVKSSFICSLDARTKELTVQYEHVPKKIRYFVYALRDFEEHLQPVPMFPFPPPRPPLVEPINVFDLDLVDTPPNQAPFHEHRQLVSVDHHDTPILPHSSGTRVSPSCSRISFCSSFERDFSPTYVFQHTYVGHARTRPFLRRISTPAIRRMAFEQDYMDSNTTERFPVGHALDLRGHELVAMGHSCAAWIEAREPPNPVITPDFDQVEYDLKVVVFPWSMEESEGGGMPREDSGSRASMGLSVCTVLCPPEVDLAKVTGLWLDAVQGRIFLGLKWGKFVVLQFD